MVDCLLPEKGERESMNINEMITQVATNLTPLNIVLLVLILANEVVANVPSIKANSIGQMLLSTLKAVLMKLWADKV
jgi:hypothetical protein